MLLCWLRIIQKKSDRLNPKNVTLSCIELCMPHIILTAFMSLNQNEPFCLPELKLAVFVFS